uniref:Uncharacterized protein n=1 Tax=Parascaris equorum TaxID=6256 RepID=A0A914SBE8_PAREQ
MSEVSASQRSEELPYSKSCTSQKKPISKACGIRGEVTSDLQEIDIVSSKSQECVELCRDRIESLIVDTRKRAYYTHFVSIPMNHPDIQAAFTRFVDAVQNDEELSVGWH